MKEFYIAKPVLDADVVVDVPKFKVHGTMLLTGAIKWGINYYSNPCVWTLLQAVDPDAYASLGK